MCHPVRRRAVADEPRVAWQVAGVTGLEPATSGVTGQRSNQLSYTPVWEGIVYMSARKVSSAFAGRCGRMQATFIPGHIARHETARWFGHGGAWTHADNA